ncbi:APH(3')-II family aminoglycoside O-phosphotransferase [Chelativorans salis]|uniref:Aminoglycoside 3'-phosphotransferase n=1 Tax=Chelativorans salis TaxID=2978478 RepID=A0ABT2LIB5_9HYPH|nr:APH(3') family aminoglycoside O-phosphotransferase [Chelativorans sp. EGI FJ00035]MCT7373966.1 aminoglycoside 3'-phosphotransferase [Chelativorans sp. EGI FJ00035]
MHRHHDRFGQPESGRAPLEAPLSWKAELSGYDWTLQTIGRSEAAVFRLTAEERPTLFVKVEADGPFAELTGEAARLRWLAERGVLCPTILSQARTNDRTWLLVTAIPGRDLASSPHMDAEEIAEIAADALRELHRLDVTDCPFDHTLDQRIDLARLRMEAGLVDEEDFDAERLGSTARQLFHELLERRPSGERLAVAHGDACLPNLLADAGRFAGFVDCGRLGVADVHQDLALAGWSISHNLGSRWLEPFFKRYGLEPDMDRLTFYRLLDEFF